jgi:DNA modification methylase
LEGKKKDNDKKKVKNSVRLEWDERKSAIFDDISSSNFGSISLSETIYPNLYSSSPGTIRFSSNIEPNDICPNTLFLGDNLDIMSALLSQGYRERFAMIYIDPPFFSEEHYYRTTILPHDNKESPRAFDQQLAYSDMWENNLDAYLEMIFPRLQAIFALLRMDGAFFLHCDQNASHYLKILCDEIFGRKNFRNEIIVKRIAKNIREAELVPRLNNGHDSILFYAKSDTLKIQPPPLENKKANWHAFDAPNIRKNLEYPILGVFPPPGRHWMWSEDITKQALKEGRIRKTKMGSIQYLINDRTTFRNNIWEDITAYAFDHEYPTEKKESLIELLFQMLPSTDGYVGDFFCGSGTTLVVAERLKRQWFGCDASEIALYTTKKRLLFENGCRPFRIWGNKSLNSQHPTPVQIHSEAIPIKIVPADEVKSKKFCFQIILNQLFSLFMLKEQNKDGIDSIELSFRPKMNPWISQFQILSGFGKKRKHLPPILDLIFELTEDADFALNSKNIEGFLRFQTILGHQYLIPLILTR